MINFLKGFIYAYNGLVVFFRHERNGRIQLGASVLVVLLGLLLSVSKWEWIVLLICIASVLSLEMINSAIEKLCNLVHPKFHPAVKVIKDISAGAVLWFSVISSIIGIIIFLPKIQHLIK
ncbi:diacylglycerol kinase family protein [Segetibacter koreensis]|uniref:diacylglycerol kinase family protein n=1 Tax=Segetibacter koreensis TaxID=398037 RepID=UPI000369234A|nr:diacylglycerol kinase family protein [Segetibacter koreensis]